MLERRTSHDSQTPAEETTLVTTNRSGHTVLNYTKQNFSEAVFNEVQIPGKSKYIKKVQLGTIRFLRNGPFFKRQESPAGSKEMVEGIPGQGTRMATVTR